MIFTSPANENIPELKSLWKEAFGDTDEFIEKFFSTAFTLQNCFCAVEDGKITSALYWFDCVHENAPVAYLYAIATFKAHQGKGICSALMQNTHEYLKEIGFKGACLVPSSESLFIFYEKQGYKTFSYVDENIFTASDSPVDVTKINKNEYACLRRRYLPKNSVLQENKNLDYLESFGEFFKGENFVFTATLENGFLVSSEFLGDISLAPAILNSLNVKKGRFRTPQGKTPFAMYISLIDNLSAPEYFGLAFD